jgi:hypothetical protein
MIPEQRTSRADLHMHTTASDGYATVREILDHVAQLGTLDVIAITDHDTMEASLWAYENRHNYPFDIIPGVEVSSRDGHVLAWWVVQPIPANMSMAETVAAIHEQGGLAAVAHPFEPWVNAARIRRYLSEPEVLLKAGVDAIEVHNAGAFLPRINWLARRLAHQLGLPIVGNSDAHSLAAIGSGSTYFAGRNAVDLRHALSTGTTSVEGESWPIADYLRLFRATIQSKSAASLGKSMPLTRQM